MITGITVSLSKLFYYALWSYPIPYHHAVLSHPFSLLHPFSLSVLYISGMDREIIHTCPILCLLFSSLINVFSMHRAPPFHRFYAKDNTTVYMGETVMEWM